jgi:hypothetical protein
MVVMADSNHPRKRAIVLVLEVDGDGDGGDGRERPPSKTRAGCRGWVVMVLT